MCVCIGYLLGVILVNFSNEFFTGSFFSFLLKIVADALNSSYAIDCRSERF